MESVAQILNEELIRRQNWNPKYSLRDFAKLLDMKPPHLCSLLKGQKGISKDVAQKIGFRIGLKPLARKRFEFLAAAQFGRSRGERNLAHMALRGLPYMPKAKQQLEDR
jgi:hypothetical protein